MQQKLGTWCRTWLVHLVGCVPVLVLLLIPQLQRSRAGSEALLGVGVAVLLALVVGAVLLSPLLSAIAAPSAPDWTPATALASARAVWRTRRAAALLALGILVVGYSLAQVVGLGIAALIPYISPSDSGWVIHYPAYALQAVVIYLLVTASLAAYATRIRSLALAVRSKS